MKLTAKATIQIQKPVDEVFEAIADPGHMTKYFISESSGRLETGKEVLWQFAEFPGEFPVTNIEVQLNERVSFVWDPETVVEIKLEARTDNTTVVRVREEGKPFSDENLKWVIDNTEGWANFLACMKAYLEYGIRLRKGAFDYLKEE